MGKFCEFCDSKGVRHKKNCPTLEEPQNEKEEPQNEENEEKETLKSQTDQIMEMLTLVVEGQKKQEKRLNKLEQQNNHKELVVFEDEKVNNTLIPSVVKDTLREFFPNTYKKIGMEITPYEEIGFLLTLIIPDELHTKRQIETEFKEIILTPKKDENGKIIPNERISEVKIIPDRRSISIIGAGSKPKIIKFYEKIKAQIINQHQQEKEPPPKF